MLLGGGSGIGRAICQALAREGASVAVAGNEMSPVKETVTILKDTSGHSNAKFLPYEVDVSKSDQVSSLVKCFTNDFGTPLSVVVNNAGIIRDSLFLKMSEDDFDDVISVNLKV